MADNTAEIHSNALCDTRRVPVVKRISGNARWPETLVLETVAHAIVDDEDFEAVSQYRWFLYNGGYAATTQYPDNRLMALHRLIFLRLHGSLPVSPKQVDHFNRVKLDCRRENLREASRSLQAANTGRRKDNVSGYRGVGWAANVQKWRARARLDRIRYDLGCFDSRHEAALAVNDFWRTQRPEVLTPNPEAEFYRSGVLDG